MMQIGSTLPAVSASHFSSRRTSFKSQMSPLNPLSRTASATRSTRVHLANLDKLLAKPPLPDNNNPTRESTNNDDSNNKGRNLLEGLNLARIWPTARSAEEMSPRHLTRLQRLLSFSAESSPRNSLGSRWRDYHGARDWAGLLDPLDENLRREVVRYGEFVQAAYRSFHTNPETPADEAPPAERHVAVPDRTYKVTKSLYATSSVGLPKWVDDVAPDLGWMTQRSSWIGYVAVCDDRREIQRMGRRDIVIALRGTATCLEWAENMRANLVGDEAKVEAGFLSLYRTPGAHVESLAEAVVGEVKRLVELYEGETLSITVTGHSLGAALAVLVGDELGSCGGDMPPVAVFSFGGPRVGNRAFSDQVEGNGVKVLRIVNSQDVITRVPGIFMEGFEERIKKSAIGKVIEEHVPLAYAHVGTELRVDTKMSPYLKPNADMACCHDLEAYLHLVDGFLASNCPFRSNAKRSLATLLKDQRSNMKQLYTSKAKSLSLNLERDDMSFHPCLPSPS